MRDGNHRMELPEHVGDGDWEIPRGPEPRHFVTFAIGAARRRKFVTLAVFLAAVAAVGVYFARKPPTYRVEARILAQRPQAMPREVRAAFEDVPTRSAWEIIHQRENLVALVRAAKLLSDNPLPPPTHQGFIETLLGHLTGRGVSEPETPLDAWVTTLDKQLNVVAQEGTIEIAIEMGDPQVAYAIVQATVQNFLESRHLQEVKAIDEVLSGLRGRATLLRSDLETELLEARRRNGSPTRAAPPRPRIASLELIQLQSLLAAKQRAIADVEEFRRRRLSDLQAQLDQARNTLSERHPTLVGLRKDIDALSAESPQIQALREEEKKLSSSYAERSAREGAAGDATASAAPIPIVERDPIESDPRVRQARFLYEQIAQRVNSAEAELDAARAAFKYRYNVVWPPQVPKEPISPNPKKIFPLGLALAVFLALGAAVAPDLLVGRIQQRWQVERQLKIDVIGEIDRRR